MATKFRRLAFAAMLLLRSVESLAAETGGPGVVVEGALSLVLDESSPLRAGDVIVAYASPATGSIPIAVHNAMQWRLFEASALLRQPWQLEVRRDGQPIQIRLANGQVLLRVRSAIGADALEAFDTALMAAIESGDRAAGDAAYASATALAAKHADPEVRALVAWHGARAATAHYEWQTGRDRLAPALAALPDGLLKISLMLTDVDCTGYLREWRTSQATLNSALVILDALAPNTLVHARVAARSSRINHFNDPNKALPTVQRAHQDALAACGRCEGTAEVQAQLGDVYFVLDQMERTRDAYAESVAITRATLPASFPLTMRLLRLASPLRRLGRPDQAEPLLREALSLMETLGVPEIERSTPYNSLGTVASQLGDLAAARHWYEKSIEACLEVSQDSIDAAAPMHNLAQVAMAEGDYRGAEQMLDRSIELLEGAGNGPNLAVFLTTRAQLEVQRGNDDLALTLLERVRDMQLAIDPNTELMGITQVELAKVHLRQGRIAESEAATERAIAILEALPGDGFALAEPLADFGTAQFGLGQLDRAETYFLRSLTLFQKLAPDSLRSTVALQGAGEAALMRKDYARAETLLNQALKIRRRDAPDTAKLAQSLHKLGRIALARQDDEKAKALFCEASDVLDRASLRIGGGDLGETRFRAQFAEVYHDCLVATAAVGNANGAVQVLERSRARGFRRLLEHRRLNLTAPGQQEAITALEINHIAYERALTSASNPALGDSARAVARERANLQHAERSALIEKLAATIPALANAYSEELPDPQLLRDRLGKDTAYVAYSVGADETVVLAMSLRHPPIARRIALSRAQLEQRVRRLRALIDVADEGATKEFRVASDELYRILLAPVSPYLADSTRLLISPDGALHDLPFAALWDARGDGYLIESHALRFVDSLGSAIPAASRSAERSVSSRLLAVGDPDMGASLAPVIARRLRSVRSAKDQLSPLPAARREVVALAARYPERTELLIGDAATEARVRSRSPSAGQLHFAVHALFDPEHPMDSALVLYPGGSGPADDGLLQVSEIFEDLRLDADLVVLSGCDTAAGKLFAGEGLLGFSRAFAFAGARATVASLWPVEDESTAELMEKFYAARDQQPDESRALQSAIVAMIPRDSSQAGSGSTRGVGGLAVRAPAPIEATRPYHWAAFQLYGR